MTSVSATGAPALDAVVIVAMDEEAAPFLAAASSVGEKAVIGNAELTPVTYAERAVLVVRAGIGFGNAGSAAVAAILTQEPGAAAPIISAGTAGGLGAEVQVGDVVVGDSYLNLNADARAFGYALGQVPGMPADYAGDGALLDALAATAEAAELTVHNGVIGSGEAFVTAERAAAIRADFEGVLAVDMESAVIAQVAHSHRVPFVSVRGISDLCAPDGTEFLTHVDDAADRSARLVLAAIRVL